ncbi:MAG: 30S ribosomal protein S12 methylthiotransferase RimO [Lachnospiraceae bacterium]|nr:30S ribosomal protein S12 methylthiotransferase RimO [Lachnospiraceae bacterium]
MKIFLVSLGCDKNLCDSENMLGMLSHAGHEITDDETQADVIIINSCSFIGDAQEESINAIIEAGRFKSEGRCRYLIVSGCLSQRFREEIREQLPEVDAMLGTASFHRICEVIDALADGTASVEFFDSTDGPVHSYRDRLLSTGGHFAYLKIAEGCSKRCSYCIIPYLRGNYRSVPMEELLDEASRLVDRGVRELILVAQETTLYGTDLYGHKSLPQLLHRLAGIRDLAWIRVLYCYPEEIDDELIEEIAANPKVVKYLDLPLQSGSDRILRAMGRLTDRAGVTDLIGRLRNRIPDICLRTTLISGFPGESEEDHQETLDLVREIRFDRLGVFPYSREKGTRAAAMKNQIPAKVRLRRRDEIMKLQQQISAEISQSCIGRTFDAFIEGRIADEDIYAARTYRDAPDVDGFIFVRCGYELMSGDIVRAVVTDASEYDLTGEITDEHIE